MQEDASLAAGPCFTAISRVAIVAVVYLFAVVAVFGQQPRRR